jgi:hypothetical protein
MTTPAKTAPSGQELAADAARYDGAGYVFGGRADKPGDWDCSSCMSYIFGHDFGMVLPGGGRWGSPGYPPNAHGPVVTAYYSWGGATTVAGPPQAGDLLIYNGVGPFGHIGMALSSSVMFSAQSAATGTGRSGIPSSLHGAPLTIRRVNATAGTPDAAPGQTGSGSDLVLAALLGLSVPAVMVIVLLGVAALAGIAAAGAGIALAARAARLPSVVCDAPGIKTNAPIPAPSLAGARAVIAPGR